MFAATELKFGTRMAYVKYKLAMLSTNYLQRQRPEGGGCGILGPLFIFGTGKAKNFKFGVRMEYATC